MSRRNKRQTFNRLYFTKRALCIGLVAVFVSHLFAVDFFETLANWFERYEAWEIDEIFLVTLLLGAAVGLDYYRSIWRHLKESNYRLERTILELDCANYSTTQSLEALQKAEAQLQQTNQELLRATRLKDEFLANMSHELRTPLNAILGMTEGLQEGIFGAVNSDQTDALQTIEQSSTHLLALINDILDVAKIESGQITLNRSPTAIAPLCRSSLVFVKQSALKKGIQLETKLPHSLPDVWLDERRIRQTLLNLLDNAVKFTPEGGRVTLKVSCQQHLDADVEDASHHHFLQIDVMDTGIGIAPEDIKTLFQPFRQLDSTLNRQYNGTGLGLVLVKRLVELHGGQVNVTSKVGVGSCFTIVLPCVVTPNSPLQTAPQAGSITISHSREQKVSPLILLAEDNEANIKTVSRYLSAKGYRMLLTSNGQEAITLAQAQQPDLILMDIQMPQMDGLEAIQWLRRDPNLRHVPIIALTALTLASDREFPAETLRDRCLAAGANEYLSKPFKLQKLPTTIQRLLTSTQP